MLAAGMAAPGPNVLAILHASLSDGRPAGRAVAMGVMTGTVVWAALTTAGLSALLSSYSAALTAIKIAGGIYLAWLALQALISAARGPEPLPSSPGHTPEGTWRSRYLRGLIIQITNPKAALVWIAIVSIGVRERAPVWVPLAIVIGATILSIVIHGTYAQVFSAPGVVRLYGRARRGIDATLGVTFGYVAYRLLTSDT
jgi:threonine/homoserine/homoserine lactone efflux protein